MTKFKIVIFVLWLVSITSAFMLGVFWNEQQPTSNVEEHLVKSKIEHSSQTTNPLIEKVTSPELKVKDESTEQVINIDEIAEAFWQAKDTSRIANVVALFQLIENLEQEQVLELLENADPQELISSEKFVQLQLLVARLAQVNPNEAMAYLANLPLKGHGLSNLVHSTLMEWASKEPEEAAGWYMSNFAKYDKKLPYGLSASRVFEKLAEKDLTHAMNLISQLKDSGADKFSSAVTGIASSLKDEAQYRELLTSDMVLDSELATRNIMRAWAEDSPESAAQWLNELESDNGKNELYGTVVEHWLKHEPEQASDWFLSKDEQPDLEALGKHWWSSGEFEKALTWVKQSPYDVSPFAKGLFSQMIYVHPDFVINNLSVLNKADSEEITLELYLWLQTNSAEKAQEFVAELPNKEELLKQAARYNQL